MLGERIKIRLASMLGEELTKIGPKALPLERCVIDFPNSLEIFDALAAQLAFLFELENLVSVLV